MAQPETVKVTKFCFPSVTAITHGLTSVHVRQYPVNELTEDLSRSLHRLLVLRRAAAASNNTNDDTSTCP